MWNHYPQEYYLISICNIFSLTPELFAPYIDHSNYLDASVCLPTHEACRSDSVALPVPCQKGVLPRSTLSFSSESKFLPWKYSPSTKTWFWVRLYLAFRVIISSSFDSESPHDTNVFAKESRPLYLKIESFSYFSAVNQATYHPRYHLWKTTSLWYSIKSFPGRNLSGNSIWCFS